MKMFKNTLILTTLMMFTQLSLAALPSDAKEQKVMSKLHETQLSLGITADQMPAWEAYEKAVVKRVDTLSQEKMKIRASRTGVEVSELEPKKKKEKGQAKQPKQYANTATERFNQQIHFEELKIQTLEDQRNAFEKLYKTLSPAQKQTADETLKVR